MESRREEASLTRPPSQFVRPMLGFVVLTTLVLLIGVGSIGVGAVNISPLKVVAALFGPDSADEINIIREVRLPRIVLAGLIGGGLAAAGAGYQGLFRNPLADPFVIGASSGSALGATWAIVSGWDGSFFGLHAVSLAAFVGALVAVGLVYGIASAGGRAPTSTLLLAGVAVTSFLGAMVWLLVFLNQQKLFVVFSWLMGSVSRGGWPVVGSTLPLLSLALATLWLCSRGLDSLAFGEESAAALGLRVNWLRGAVVVAASLATAVCVAAGGIIGFVGLIAPHAARLVFGSRHSLLIPASCLSGGLLMLVADDVSRVAVAPSELPVGIVTALLGGPFFLYLLKTRQHQLGPGI